MAEEEKKDGQGGKMEWTCRGTCEGQGVMTPLLAGLWNSDCVALGAKNILNIHYELPKTF